MLPIFCLYFRLSFVLPSLTNELGVKDIRCLLNPTVNRIIISFQNQKECLQDVR